MELYINFLIMNVVYLISTGKNKNNIEYLDNNLNYKFLSLENHKTFSNISNLLKNIDRIYTSQEIKTIEAGIYFATKNKITLNVDKAFNNIDLGNVKTNLDKDELERRLIQDFDYSKYNAESINDVKKRVSEELKIILFHNPDTNSIIITHKYNIIALLSIWCTVGLNYDNNLILTYKDKVIIDGIWNKPLIFKLCFDGKDLQSLEKIEY